MLVRPMKLKLQSILNGAYTGITISGSFPTMVQQQRTRQLIWILSMWSGEPVQVVLSADDGADLNKWSSWADIWSYNLLTVPERRLRFRISRPLRKSRADHFANEDQLALFKETR